MAIIEAAMYGILRLTLAGADLMRSPGGMDQLKRGQWNVLSSVVVDNEWEPIP